MGVKRRWIMPGLVLLAVAAAGVGVAMAATMSSKGGTVKAAHSSKYGSLLVSAAGMTLYHYTPDKHGTVKCTAACAKFWPPLVVARGVKPSAGAGVSAAKLSTVKRSDGTTQVTYAGFPLYRYSADKKSGDVKGQGFQGVWHAVTSAGTLAKASGSTGTTTTMPGTTTDSGGGYGGYGP
jgi:predicted lipoprotein with Yx(FWY)xxD motif